MGETIIKSKASSKDIERIVNTIAEVVDSYPETHVMMACISLALLIQNPELSMEQLAEGVLGASEWMALYISTIDNPKQAES